MEDYCVNCGLKLDETNGKVLLCCTDRLIVNCLCNVCIEAEVKTDKLIHCRICLNKYSVSEMIKYTKESPSNKSTRLYPLGDKVKYVYIPDHKLTSISTSFQRDPTGVVETKMPLDEEYYKTPTYSEPEFRPNVVDSQYSRVLRVGQANRIWQCKVGESIVIEDTVPEKSDKRSSDEVD